MPSKDPDRDKLVWTQDKKLVAALNELELRIAVLETAPTVPSVVIRITTEQDALLEGLAPGAVILLEAPAANTLVVVL